MFDLNKMMAIFLSGAVFWLCGCGDQKSNLAAVNSYQVSGTSRGGTDYEPSDALVIVTASTSDSYVVQRFIRVGLVNCEASVSKGI